MFCVRILRCSSSVLFGLHLLFLVEGKCCIKHVCENFGITIVLCIDHDISNKSVV
jgi:hypothetical protein